MLIISKEQVENLIQKLGDPKNLGEARDEVKKMLEIKSALLWRAEGAQSCCGSLEGIKTCLASEVMMLEAALNALEKGSISQSLSLLREYMGQMEQLRQ